MQIASSIFKNQESIPAKYTCDGDDINPPLQIFGVPENAKSLVLIVYDPDAPKGTWVHWTLFNIDPKTSEIAENSVPDNATQGKTSWDRSEYGGPCPPFGTHRYFFKLFALDNLLNLDSNAKAEDIYQAIEGHILADAGLMGRYQRN